MVAAGAQGTEQELETVFQYLSTQFPVEAQKALESQHCAGRGARERGRSSAQGSGRAYRAPREERPLQEARGPQEGRTASTTRRSKRGRSGSPACRRSALVLQCGTPSNDTTHVDAKTVLVGSAALGRRNALGHGRPDGGRRHRSDRMGEGREVLHARQRRLDEAAVARSTEQHRPLDAQPLSAAHRGERDDAAGTARGRPGGGRHRRPLRDQHRERSGAVAPQVREPAHRIRRRSTTCSALAGRRPCRRWCRYRRASTRSTPCPGTAGCTRSTSATARTSRRPRSSFPATASRMRSITRTASSTPPRRRAAAV